MPFLAALAPRSIHKPRVVGIETVPLQPCQCDRSKGLLGGAVAKDPLDTEHYFNHSVSMRNIASIRPPAKFCLPLGGSWKALGKGIFCFIFGVNVKITAWQIQ
jgi:hypothetical protein